MECSWRIDVPSSQRIPTLAFPYLEFLSVRSIITFHGLGSGAILNYRSTWSSCLGQQHARPTDDEATSMRVGNVHANGSSWMWATRP